MAKKITEESLRLNIIVNGDQGRKAILDLESAVGSSTAKLNKLKGEIASLESKGKTSGRQFNKLQKDIEKESKALDDNRKRLETLRRQQSLTTMTMSELRKHINQTRIALGQAIPGTSNWSRLNAELQKAKTQLKQMENALMNC